MNKKLLSVIVIAVVLIATIVTISSCTNDGQTVIPHLHTYEKVDVTAPTCIAKGYTTYQCSACGHQIRREFVDINESNHFWRHSHTIEATCSEYGYDVQKCEYCGINQYVNFTKPVHVMDNGEVIMEECNGKIVIGYTCKICGIYSETVEDTFATEDGNVAHRCDNLIVVAATDNRSGYSVYECDCHRYSLEKFDFVAPHNAKWFTFETFTNYSKGETLECSVRGQMSISDEHIVIPYDYMGSPVTEIAISAFQYATNLKSITVPHNIVYIGDHAFYNATKLEKIIYEGTISQWKAMAKKFGANWAPSNAVDSPASVADALENDYFYIECSDGRLYMDGSILLNHENANERFIPARITVK